MGAYVKVRERRGANAAAPAIFNKGSPGNKSCLVWQSKAAKNIWAKKPIKISHGRKARRDLGIDNWIYRNLIAISRGAQG